MEFSECPLHLLLYLCTCYFLSLFSPLFYLVKSFSSRLFSKLTSFFKLLGLGLVLPHVSCHRAQFPLHSMNPIILSLSLYLILSLMLLLNSFRAGAILCPSYIPRAFCCSSLNHYLYLDTYMCVRLTNVSQSLD